MNADLSPFLNSCDILLLCYDTTRFWAEASNSHKIMEYLSTGKPVVSTRMAEYIDKKSLLIMPDKNELLPELLASVGDNLLKYNSEQLVFERKDFARQNTYANALKKIREHLHATI
jgi:hypothetical protein